MEKIRALCKKHKIKVCSLKEIDFRAYVKYISNGEYTTAMSASDIYLPTGKQSNKRIGLMPKAGIEALWHEAGHLIHPLGQTGPSTLVNELAASSWAILNYDPSEPSEFNVPMPEFKRKLKDWIMSYINGGHSMCVNDDRFRIMARIIGIEDKITWVNLPANSYRRYRKCQ